MRKVLGVALALMCISALVFAADRAPLSDRQLSAVTAGGNFGDDSYSGAIAANHSTATIVNKGTVSIAGQSDAKTLNLVNAVDSKFGAGLNVWSAPAAVPTDAESDGRWDKGGWDKSPLNQKNVVVQQSDPRPNGAYLSGYQRGSELDLAPSSLTVAYNNTTSRKESESFSKWSSLNIDSNTDTHLKVDANYWHKSGFFGASTGPVVLDSAADPLVVAGYSKTGANLDAYYSRRTDFDLNAEEKINRKEWESYYSKTNFGLQLSLGQLNYRGPMSLDEADAEVIAVDGSTAKEINAYAVTVAAGAQAGASAVNLVNAANSLVGVGTNVTSASLTGSGSLKQTNVIIQK